MLMLLHVRIAGMKGLHEWIGVLLVVAGAVHLALNWRPFLDHLRSRAAAIALAAVAALCVGLVFAGGSDHGRPHMGPPQSEFAGGDRAEIAE